jgi:hypothetical protein
MFFAGRHDDGFFVRRGQLSGNIHKQSERVSFYGFEGSPVFVYDKIRFDGLRFCPEDQARRF